MFNVSKHVIDCKISHRGGSLKVDVSELFPNVDNPIMGAYQNYLGGGIAGSIQGGSMFDPSELSDSERDLFDETMESIKRYFYSLNEGGGDEYMHENHTGPDAGGYDAVQRLPKSGY